MKRKVIEKLIFWNENTCHKQGQYTHNTGKPIGLTGAKGVGKTYLAYDFAKSFFDSIIYINPEHNTKHQKLLEGTVTEIIENISTYANLEQESSTNHSVLILDELQLSHHILEYLNHPEFKATFPRIIVITSYGIAYEYHPYFYQTILVTPLEFDEFLLAIGKDWYVDSILTHYESNKPLPDIVHTELLGLYDLYLQIGGMPGLINEYLSISSVINIQEQHETLFGVYQSYINQCFHESEALKMNQVMGSLPKQLLKENKKFQYKLIRKGTTHSMYKEAIQNLHSRHNLLQAMRCSTEMIGQYQELLQSEFELRGPKSGNPIRNWFTENQDSSTNFKLYLFDVGFLYTKIIEECGTPLDDLGKKALLENYVAQALHSKNLPLLFWESDSKAKLDFILPIGKNIIPLEIHVGENTRSKSMSILKQSYDIPYGIKISKRNFQYANQIKYVPYYAVFCI